MPLTHTIYQGSDIVLAFVLRTVFIRTMAKAYLGLSGLFANILTVLSLMDLGVGGAIVFSLYKPLAEGNHGKVAALMQLYKTVYRCIGFLVLLFGLSLTPFLSRIIKLPDNVDTQYIRRYIFQILITALIAIGGKEVLKVLFHLHGLSILTWVLSGMILTVVCLVLVILFYGKTEEMTFLKEIIKKKLLRKKFLG